MRRDTCNSSASLKAAGAVRSRIVEKQRHFGGVARRPRCRAGEDDVVHAGRAHVLVGAFAHHPAQRLDEIRLAAAIRPDDAGQAALDDELGRFDEGFEAEQAKAVELHPRTPGRIAQRRAPERRLAWTSEQRVDDGRHFLNRHRSRIAARH